MDARVVSRGGVSSSGLLLAGMKQLSLVKPSGRNRCVPWRHFGEQLAVCRNEVLYFIERVGSRVGSGRVV